MWVQPKSPAGIAVVLILIAIVSTLLVVVQDERVTFTQETVKETSSVWDDDDVIEQMMTSLHITSPEDQSQRLMQDVEHSHSKKSIAEKLVNYANGLSNKKSNNKMSALMKHATRLVSRSKARARDSKKLTNVKSRIANRRKELKELKRQIKLHKGLLTHHKQRADDLSDALGEGDFNSYSDSDSDDIAGNVHRGPNVDKEVRRARQVEQREKARIDKEHDWLSSARAKAKAAMRRHKLRITLHKAKLRRLRYFLNRMMVEDYADTTSTGYGGDGDRGASPLPEEGQLAEDDSMPPGWHPQWDSYLGLAGNIPGRQPYRPKLSEEKMKAINKAMGTVYETEPPTSRAEDKAYRAQIQAAVHAAVTSETYNLRRLHLTEEQEQGVLRKTIQEAVVKAVSQSIKQKSQHLAATPTPNAGKLYVTHEALTAADMAMTAARAKGQNNREVKRVAMTAARRASEIATRQVAQSVARSAALRAAQMAADTGHSLQEQKVAAQVAARAAVKRIVKGSAALRYLNRLQMQAMPGTKNRGHQALRHVAREAQQADDRAAAGGQGMPDEFDTPSYALPRRTRTDNAVLLGASLSSQTPSTPSTPSAALAPEAPAPEAPVQAALPKLASSDSTASSLSPVPDEGEPAQAAIVGPAAGNRTQNEEAPFNPLEARVQLEAALLKAAAAGKSAKAAAYAAQNAPPGAKGEAIVAQARIIAAEAARDVADARMKAELLKLKQNPKPIVHQAASEAVKIALPIATEMATQSATLQATKAAVAAAKSMMQQKSVQSVHASDAAQDVVEASDTKLKEAVRTRIGKSVSDAVASAIAKANKDGTATKSSMLAAAKQAAAEEARRVEQELVSKQIKDVSKLVSMEAAAAAEKAGGDAQQVESIRRQASNTIRLNGDDAMRAEQDQAERDAEDSATKAGAALEEAATAGKAKAAVAAKAALDVAITDAASGQPNAAEDSLKAAQSDVSGLLAAKTQGAALSGSSATAGQPREATEAAKAGEAAAVRGTAGEASADGNTVASQEVDADIGAIEKSAIANADGSNIAANAGRAPDEVLLEELLFA